MVFEQLNLKELNRSGKSNLVVEDAFTFDDLPVSGLVGIQAQVHLSSTGVSVFGKYHGTLLEPCDRCAELFERPFNALFEDKFVYAALTDTGLSGEIELHEEDFYDTIGPDSILDLQDLIRQHIILLMSHDRVCNQPGCDFLETSSDF